MLSGVVSSLCSFSILGRANGFAEVIAEARQIFHQNMSLIAELDKFEPPKSLQIAAKGVQAFFGATLVLGAVYFGYKLFSSTSNS